jgi:two-component system, chemotaxis family, chemotaxis protein CheY
MRFLIVDDSKAMRMIIARVLRQAGYGGSEFAEAANGLEALELIRADRPDLVLCDWNMPEMTGIELLRTLRDESVDVRFGFVTAESTAEMTEQAYASGALFVIAKPFTGDSFREVLAGVVS